MRRRFGRKRGGDGRAPIDAAAALARIAEAGLVPAGDLTALDVAGVPDSFAAVGRGEADRVLTHDRFVAVGQMGGCDVERPLVEGDVVGSDDLGPLCVQVGGCHGEFDQVDQVSVGPEPSASINVLNVWRPCDRAERHMISADLDGLGRVSCSPRKGRRRRGNQFVDHRTGEAGN